MAKSVMWESKLVILDEPTAALGVAQTRQVLDLVRRLAERDLGVVLVSHNLHDVFEAAPTGSRCSDSGQRVAVLDRAKTTQQEVVEAITAGTLDHVPGHGSRRGGDGRVTESDVSFDPTASAVADSLPPAPPPGEQGAAQETLAGFAQRWWQGVKAGELGRFRSSSGSRPSSSSSACSTTRSSPSATSPTSCCRWRRSPRSRSGSSSCS